jgi:hypothetical protein
MRRGTLHSLRPATVVYPLSRFAPALLICAALGLASTAWAGGGGFGSDEDSNQDAGPPYFGVVKDKDGKALADAKITATIAKSNSSLVLRADSQGHFFIRGFDKSIDPGDVTISCSKEGYRETQGIKAPATGAAPIEVVCVLDHE